MKTVTITLILTFCSVLSFDILFAQSEVPTAEQQIHAAVSPAPDGMKEDAKVLGFNEEGEMIVLREGSNDLICLADNPNDERFHVSCYHKDLEPFMKRGRELRADGIVGDESRQVRHREIENGELHLPEKPMALYSLFGGEDAWDYSTHTLQAARPLYVIYIPYATVESTGLATSPVSDGAPWLMDAGTPWAHIMVGTGRTLGESVDP